MPANSILIIEDKLGISQGYASLWYDLWKQAGLVKYHEIKINLHSIFPKEKLLIKKGNGKALIFNNDPYTQTLISEYIADVIQKSYHNIAAIICQDSAALGLVEPNWRDATIDKLRGGVYEYLGFPFIILPPVSSINTFSLQKDVKILNAGYASEEEFIEENPDGVFNIPYVLKAGRWILLQDLKKVNRIINNHNYSQEI